MKTSTLRSMWQWPWLEILLGLSIISLVVQIAGPSFMRWRQLPRPGSVGINYLTSEFYQDDLSNCIAPAYVGYLPTHYAQREVWPLVVFLHGSGKRGNDPQALMKWGRFLSSPTSTEMPAIVLVPQCRARQYWQPKDIAAFVEYACQEYPIDRRRIYLIGSSMGGYGTWRAAAAYPGVFAAVAPVCGGGDTEKAPAMVNIPIWAFHGAKDKVVPVENSTNVVDAIRQKGGNPKLTIFPEAGHGIPYRVFKMPELWQWLFKQNLEERNISPQLESVAHTENED